MTDHCPACPFKGCPDCRYQGGAHFQAVMVDVRVIRPSDLLGGKVQALMEEIR